MGERDDYPELDDARRIQARTIEGWVRRYLGDAEELEFLTVNVPGPGDTTFQLACQAIVQPVADQAHARGGPAGRRNLATHA